MIDLPEALRAGWDDYYAGVHTNRYDFDFERGNPFRWWIDGYNAAKDWSFLMEDVE